MKSNENEQVSNFDSGMSLRKQMELKENTEKKESEEERFQRETERIANRVQQGGERLLDNKFRS